MHITANKHASKLFIRLIISKKSSPGESYVSTWSVVFFTQRKKVLILLVGPPGLEPGTNTL